MRSHRVGERAYLTRKYQRARNLLIEQYGYSMAECADRAWCYRQLAALGWRWDSAAGRWRARLNRV